MHLIHLLPTASFLLTTLLLPFQTLSSPSPDPNPAPNPAKLAQANGPVSVPNLSSGAGVQIANGNSRVYYQALDGSIRELLGIGSPGPNRIYFDQILLPAGRARIGTPIAAIDTSTALAIRLYYISPDDRLREYIYDTRWRDGTLNNANITTRSGTRYLWAMTVPNLVRPRVGYVAPNGDLSEVALDGSEWVRNIF